MKTEEETSTMLKDLYNSIVLKDIVQRGFDAFLQVPDNFPKYVISMDKMDFSRDGIIHKNALRFLMEK